MNERPGPSPEDIDFDKYLARDSALSQQYHSAIDDQPAPSIDAAVKFRAAAQAQRLRMRRYARWTVPVALAASVVFAVTALLQAPSSQLGALNTAPTTIEGEKKEGARRKSAAPLPEVVVGISQSAVSPSELAVETAPAPAATPSVAPAPAPVMQERRADLLDKAVRALSEAGHVETEPESRIENALPERDAISSTNSAEERQAPEPSQPFAAANSAGAAVPAAPAMLSRSAKPQANLEAITTEKRAEAAKAAVKLPEAWLQEIALLRKQGKVIEAEEQMKQFRARYPGYRIPVSASQMEAAAPVAEPESK